MSETIVTTYHELNIKQKYETSWKAKVNLRSKDPEKLEE